MPLIDYLKKNIDLTLAMIFAIVASLFVPFSLSVIIEEINLSLLFLLFCMMAVVAGFRRSGIFTWCSRCLFARAATARQIARLLIFMCFFVSMVITNDVALITFVPMTLLVLREAQIRGYMIFVIVMQTVAANMGSMFTPIGNPQNLYVYSYYQLGLGEFLFYTGPTVFLSFLLLYGATYYVKERPVVMPSPAGIPLKRGPVCLLSGLFILCILSVLRVLPVLWLLLIVVPALFVFDRAVFKDVDYKLLLLFVFLFIGVGSLAQWPFMQSWPTEFLRGNEFFVSLFLSQVISNVPATVMLARYTNDAVPLLLGVNIGGLGTIIASMASIISFKAYAGQLFSRKSRYLIVFTAVNVMMLMAIIGVRWILAIVGMI